MLKKKPTEYLNQLYFDPLVFTSEAQRHIVAQKIAILSGTAARMPGIKVWKNSAVGGFSIKRRSGDAPFYSGRVANCR